MSIQHDQPFDYNDPVGPRVSVEEAFHWVVASIIAALTVWALFLVGR